MKRAFSAHRLLFGLGYLCAAGSLTLLAACSVTGSKPGPAMSRRMVQPGQQVPKGHGVYKIGKPYQIQGQWYYPREDVAYDRVGIASWYGSLFHGRKTANGEIFDMDALTAAHPTLPLPVLVRVTNLENGRALVVRVNDRGPYRHNRVIDLSRRSAHLLGFKHKGTARVRVTYLRRAPMNGDDSYERLVLRSQPWYRVAAVSRHYSRDHSPRRQHTASAARPTTAPRQVAAWSQSAFRLGPADGLATGWRIQVGMFRIKANADRLVTRLTGLGAVRIEPVMVRDRLLHKVVLGPFDDREAAMQSMVKLTEIGLSGSRLLTPVR